MGTDDYFDCDCYCENTGKCRRCKGAGKLMENCTACYGLGKITKTMYCNH
jgi:DnaJ-class molecular chaperone